MGIKLPTIGFITFDTGGTYNSRMWQGVLLAASQNRTNIITLCGGMLYSDDKMHRQWNRIYDLAASPKIDALIVLSASISHFCGPDKLYEFLNKFKSIPIVSIGMEVPGMPSVLIDNEYGMRSVVRHMILENGVRKPVFLKGPENNAEAISRYETFKSVMEENNLNVNPELVRMADFRLDFAKIIMEELIQDRKEFDAVIASNDDMALGAMEVLKKHGIPVPEKITVSGFDNTETARYGAVPLTTVSQPAEKMAEAAHEIVLKLLKGEKVEPISRLPAELVVRKSCGCLSVNILRGEPGNGGKVEPVMAGDNPLENADFGKIEGLLAGGWKKELWDKMESAVKSIKDSELLMFLDFLIRKTIQSGLDDLDSWNEMLSYWRSKAIVQYSNDRAELIFIEDFFQKARILIAETGNNLQSYSRMLIKQRDFLLMVFSANFYQVINLNKFITYISTELPNFGISGCSIALYEKDDFRKSRLLMSFQQDGRVYWDREGEIFPTIDIFPPSFKEEERHDLVVEPVMDYEDIIGFIVFQIQEPLDMMENIRQSVSNALTGVIMIQEVLKDRQLEELFRDLEQKQHELEKAYQSLKTNQETMLIVEKMASLGRMTAGIAHEMNTPVAAIRTSLTEMSRLITELDRSVGDPDVTNADFKEIIQEMLHSLELADKSAEKAAAFVHGIKSQTRDLDPKDRFRFNAVTIIREALLLLGHSLKHGHCEAVIDPESEYMELYGAPGRFSQVVTNLVNNSIDACTDKKNGLIRISLKTDGEFTVLTIRDNGCGISRENMTKIFDPMFTTKPFGVGTGLGLTLVHNIILGEFGGKIDVESIPGESTEIILRFPKIKEVMSGEKV